MDTKKLRQKILDLAIHGKLVPQDPNDEPASVLLERIRAEKERLIAEGKIKRSKKSSTSDTPHYENVPEGWCYVVLNEIAFIGTGSTPSKSQKQYYGGNIPWISSSATNNSFISEPTDFITEKAIKETNCQLYPVGTIIMAMYGEGKTRGQVSELSIECCTNQACAGIIPYLPETKKYIKLYLQSQYYHLRSLAEGGNQPNLNIGKISSYVIPLPPVAEQRRILHVVEKYFLIASIIESSKSDIRETINKAKNHVLDLAIHGKLVPQDPTDEPASELLKRINPKAAASCDNPHYGILPENWCWVKLGQLFNIVSAKRVTKDQWKSVGVPFYRTREIVQLSQDGHVDNDLFIDIEHYESLKNKYGIPRPGDIMLTAVGTIGKTYVVSQDDKFYYKDASVLCMKNVHNINSKYIELAFCSTLVQKQLYEKSKGTTVDTITIEKANNYIFPIPPIEEQNRIVIKVKELFSQLDMIEKSLQA